MLLPIQRLLDVPIMSLQTGSELAHTQSPIVDPRNMTIVAFYVEGRLLETTPSVLHIIDIRELSDIGMIIDDSDKLMSTSGLVRLQEMIDYGFELLGIQVVDENGTKYGRVSDYAVDPDAYTIQQIYTEQSLLKSFSNVSSLIHRSQIVTVTNEQIIIKSPTVPADAQNKPNLAHTLANPFRPKPQREA